MIKGAALFPGQGSQYVGMSRELADEFDTVRETFEEADDVLGFSLSKLCFEGPMEELTKTANTQPALLTASVATFRLLQSAGYRPEAAAGHSLGEYSALVAAEAISFVDALRTVRLRGQLMEEAQPQGSGTMAAILGLDDEDVVAICCEVSGVVEPAAYNAPGQIVVAGSVPAVTEALEVAKAKGARRAQLLSVSGPFHSSLLAPAGEKLREWLADIHIDTPKIPVYSNVTDASVSDPAEIKENLASQVSSAVRWTMSVRAMIDAGSTTFVEMGPGRVLSGLVRRIDRKVIVFNVETPKDYQELIDR